ncbi:LppU/SCO3897 family protein [Gordonia sp. MP11Mi]|uniref:DUF4333 domain-containing protein n=1 Tax=Gordonia sp. MP11Mi TaxID=3022769 RepID=A0AA97CWN3_9ACTN
MTTPPTPGQPGQQPGPTSQPGNPFSQPGSAGAQGPAYGQQQPAYGQQQPVYGQQQPGYGQQQPVGGYAPIPGTPGYPTPPPSPQSNRPVQIIIAVVGVVVVIAAAVLYFAFRNNDDGTSVDSTPTGSCISVTSGELSNVTTEAIACDTTSALSYVVASKAGSEDACQRAGLPFSITEYGTGASDDVLCLMPNFVKGNCYQQDSIAMGLGLKAVSCTEESSLMTIVFKVTERVDSTAVPNCTDSSTQKVYAATIKSDPPRALGVCAELQGDYTWQE